jgi:hypothetical protein
MLRSASAVIAEIKGGASAPPLFRFPSRISSVEFMFMDFLLYERSSIWTKTIAYSAAGALVT